MYFLVVLLALLDLGLSALTTVIKWFHTIIDVTPTQGYLWKIGGIQLKHSLPDWVLKTKFQLIGLELQPSPWFSRRRISKMAVIVQKWKWEPFDQLLYFPSIFEHCTTRLWKPLLFHLPFPVSSLSLNVEPGLFLLNRLVYSRITGPPQKYLSLSCCSYKVQESNKILKQCFRHLFYD